MDDVVGGELVGVLLGRDVAERQVHGAPRDDARRRGHDGHVGGRPGRGERVVAQQVALEPVAHLLDRGALHERHRPQVLVDEVVEQRPDVPVGARRRPAPAVGRDAVECGDPVEEALDAAPVQIGLVHGVPRSVLSATSSLAGERP